MDDIKLSEDQVETLEKIIDISDKASEALEKNNELFEKLKEQLGDPSTREDVLFSVIKNSTDALIAIDSQFTEIALRVEAVMKGHNDMVARFNETVGNRNWLAAMVDTRLDEREKLLIEESQIGRLKELMSPVRMGFISDEDKPKLEVGQIRTYIKYPMNPEQFTEEDLDLFSSNIVETLENINDEDYKRITKTDNKILYSAASLFFSEQYTLSVQEGNYTPVVIKTLDKKDYVLLDVYLDLEIKGNSIEG